MNGLTKSLEDYLEAIWVINMNKRAVRVKDLMAYFDYKVSSVNNALKILASKELINHERYGYIELTEKGNELAREIYNRHKNIANFLSFTLQISNEEASRQACIWEHYLDENTYENIIIFLDFIKDNKECLKEFHRHLKSIKKEKEETNTMKRLSELKSGDRAVVKSIKGIPEIKGRLLSMGITKKEELTVMEIAPLGEPINIEIRGYKLSLRKNEAECIEVEVLS